MTYNALLADALLMNQDIRSELAQKPLSQATLDNLNSSYSLEYQDSRTQVLLKYVTSCALSDTQTPLTGFAGDSWKGELGLCPGWALLQPGADCLQIVSACVIARVNAVGKKVLISMRGGPFSSTGQVRVQKELRERIGNGTGTTEAHPIKSWHPCTSPTSPGDPTRTCQWKELYVGRCTAGGIVQASVNDTNKMLRVCRGLHGCENPFPASAMHYAGPLVDGISTVTFTCPTNGPLQSSVGSQSYGYFSLMIAYHNPADMMDPTLETTTVSFVSASAVTYPASEEQVFTFREGGFYGSIFGPIERPNADVKSEHALPGQSYACYNEGWSCSLAEHWDRFCAGMGGGGPSAMMSCTPTGAGMPPLGPATLPEQCFDNVPQPCSAQCSLVGTAMSGSYDMCTGDTMPYPHPISVYLSTPCDLMDDACNPGQFVPDKRVQFPQ